jgi:hypothetical protein
MTNANSPFDLPGLGFREGGAGSRSLKLTCCAPRGMEGRLSAYKIVDILKADEAKESSMQRCLAHTGACVAGLTVEEAVEFEVLDALPPPFDDSGEIWWIFQGEPTSRREKRWLELYTKAGSGA